ncbi:hypothetical protein D3C86_1960050 [compost metagenome]
MPNAGAELSGDKWRQRRLNQPQCMPIAAWAFRRAGCDRWHRFGNLLASGAGAELGQVRYGDRVTVGFGNGLERLFQ